MPQATVKSYDHDSREAVLLDDGLVELYAPASAMQRSGLRELRIGQRVRFTLEVDAEGDEPVVQNLQIVSL